MFSYLYIFHGDVFKSVFSKILFFNSQTKDPMKFIFNSEDDVRTLATCLLIVRIEHYYYYYYYFNLHYLIRNTIQYYNS